MQVNMHEAKSQLSRLGELACQGERVIIAKAGKPYLDLIPYREGKQEPRKLGILKDQGWPEPEYVKFTYEELVEVFGEDIIGPPGGDDDADEQHPI